MYKSPVRRFAPLFYWRTACVDAPDAMSAGWLHHALEVEGLEGQIPKVPPMFDQLIRAWRKLNQHRRLEIVLRFMSGPQQVRMTELASGIHDRSNALSTVAFRLEQSLLDAVSHDMAANPVLVRMMDANRAVRETRRASRAILEYPDVREVAAAWRRCCRSRHPHLWNKATVATALYAKPNTKAMKRLQAEDCPAHKAA